MWIRLKVIDACSLLRRGDWMHHVYTARSVWIQRHHQRLHMVTQGNKQSTLTTVFPALFKSFQRHLRGYVTGNVTYLHIWRAAQSSGCSCGGWTAVPRWTCCCRCYRRTYRPPRTPRRRSPTRGSAWSQTAPCSLPSRTAPRSEPEKHKCDVMTFIANNIPRNRYIVK